MKNKKDVNALLSVEEMQEIRKIADTIHIGNSFPDQNVADIRSEIFTNALTHAEEIAKHRNELTAFVTQMMKNDILDELRKQKTRKECLMKCAERITAEDPESEEDRCAAYDVAEDPWDEFLQALESNGRRRQRMRAWRERFRRRVEGLPEDMRQFLNALASTESRAELAAVTGLSRKSCYNRHMKLREIFQDLLKSYKLGMGKGKYKEKRDIPPTPPIENKETCESNAHARSVFRQPTVDEIRAYCKERKNTINAEEFFDFYESKGWMIGRNKMRNWQSAVRNWERNHADDMSPMSRKINMPRIKTADNVRYNETETDYGF